MSRPKDWFVKKRAEALVFSLFAERSLRVFVQPHHNFDVDLLVNLQPSELQLSRLLGVDILSADGPLPDGELKAKLNASLTREKLEETMVPVVLFFINVRESTHSYLWVKEPVVTTRDVLLKYVHPAPEPAWRHLDDQAVDRILAQTHAYYDALYGRVKKVI